jgi:hypothetical protein
MDQVDMSLQMYVLDESFSTELTLGYFVRVYRFQMQPQLRFIFEYFFAVLARVLVEMFSGYVYIVVLLDLK